MATCHGDSHSSGGVAGFSGAYVRVVAHVGVRGVAGSLVLPHVTVDGGGVFTVCHERYIHGMGCLEECVEGGCLIYEHITCAGAHEDFYAGNGAGVEGA